MSFSEKWRLLKENGKLIRILCIILAIVAVSASYFLGSIVMKSYFNKGNSNNKQVSSEELKSLENELNLCLFNKASMSASQDDGAYNFSTFKIYSPLFQNKTVSKTEYEYKRALITSRVIEVDNNTKVIVWVLEKPSQYLPSLPERLSKKTNPLDLTYPLYDFPIISGYEFADFVQDKEFVSLQIPESPIASNTYTSRRDVKMYRRTNYCPKSACLAELYFYTTTDQGKTQIFVQVLSNIQEVPGSNNNTSEAGAFKNVELVADTLSTEKY